MKKLQLLLLLSIIFIVNINGQKSELPQNWYHLDAADDNYNGVSEIKAYNTLLKGKKSKHIIVAVIDSGIDKDHEDLKNIMWTNPKEIAGNGIDDDKNGYIDDIHGWNFIGGPGGKNINGETLEITRLFNKLMPKYENADTTSLSKKEMVEYHNYIKYGKKIEEELLDAANQLEYLNSVEKRLFSLAHAIDSIIPGDILSKSIIDTIQTPNNEAKMLKEIAYGFIDDWGDNKTFSQLEDAITEALKDNKTYYNDKIMYNYNTNLHQRATIVGDDPNNLKEKYYGNNDSEGPDALHGTHVAGIIAAQRGNGIGMDGIAANVSIMSVRAVPNGDERDKDVANAIRYAVDNGASIINMSFGKGHSWNKRIVDKAVRYAEKHDVLLVHAAGNSAQNNDTSDNFPNDKYEKIGFLFWKKKRAKNWLEIGALSYEKGKDLVAGFSNYGKVNVDVFAPGMKIYSTVPNNKYKNLQGTSMASPVVAGIAAVIRSYYPRLTAKQVKNIIMKSSIKHNIDVNIPGKDGEIANFSQLSITGGVANLYSAIKLAAKTPGKK